MANDDIITRLRDGIVHEDYRAANDLMDEAAGEIERLRTKLKACNRAKKRAKENMDFTMSPFEER